MHGKPVSSLSRLFLQFEVQPVTKEPPGFDEDSCTVMNVRKSLTFPDKESSDVKKSVSCLEQISRKVNVSRKVPVC